MKILPLTLTLGSLLFSSPAFARHDYFGERRTYHRRGYPTVIVTESNPGWSSSTQCTKTEYREEYIPGTINRPGRVKKWTETVIVPCNSVNHTGTVKKKNFSDDNSCVEGTVIGGILGGGIAAGVSKSDAYAWSIPLGVVGGALVGCQVDGG